MTFRMTPASEREQLQVVGRDDELSSIVTFLDRLLDGPTALVLEGESGIGKTTLWQRGVALARERGWRTLTVRPAESEATLSFAGLADLLQGASDTLDGLPDPQRNALEVALLRADPIGPPPEPRAVFAAVLEELRAVAARSPVLLALDDVQWLDRSTRDALEFAIRRFDGEPIGTMIAVREDGATLPLGVSRSLPEGRVTRLRVDPLSPDAINDLLRARLDARFPPSTFRQLYEMSGGNPFFALEIGRAAMRGDRRATGMALPVPRSLREDLVRSRVDALPAQVREMLLYASATSRPTIALLEAAVARAPLTPQIEKATNAGIVQVSDGVVSFTHPLYGSAIYADASREHRHQVHRRLAEVVGDVEERARHLALAADGPDVRIAAELEEAAHQAAGRGSPIAAAELDELAERLTPREAADDLTRRRLAAADRWIEAGDPGRAEGLAELALTAATSGGERAEALWRLALCHHDDARRVTALSSEALSNDGVPAPLMTRLRTLLTWGLAEMGELSDAESQADVAIVEAERLGDPQLTVEALDAGTCVAARRGNSRASDLLQRAEETADVAGLGPNAVDPTVVVTEPAEVLVSLAARRLLLVQAGDLTEVEGLLRSLLENARIRGDEFATIEVLSELADIAWRVGDWTSASTSLAELRRLAPDAIQPVAIRALVEAYRGDDHEAIADAERALDGAHRSGLMLAEIASLHALGHVRLARGDAAGAIPFLTRAWDTVERCGYGDPGDFPFVPDHMEALIDVGELGEAEPIVEWLEERGRTLDRAYALATGARCRGLLVAARGDPAGGIAAVEEALEHHERLPMPFELARTYLVLGGIRRRDKQKRSAREALEHALQIFEELGARLWAERTRAELARIGGRRAVVGELTEAERRVATLAAAGRTNREIADTLFTSVRTVEGHLSHVYAKLGIRSRTELAVFLDEPDRASDS